MWIVVVIVSCVWVCFRLLKSKRKAVLCCLIDDQHYCVKTCWEISSVCKELLTLLLLSIFSDIFLCADCNPRGPVSRKLVVTSSNDRPWSSTSGEIYSLHLSFGIPGAWETAVLCLMMTPLSSHHSWIGQEKQKEKVKRYQNVWNVIIKSHSSSRQSFCVSWLQS